MKLNNRGFAISTILYGLLLVGVLIMALLMNTASFNLMTTKDFVDKTEQELNDTADSYYGSGQSCDFSGGECKALRTGYYKINLCSGICTTGTIFLVVGQKLYLRGSEIRLDSDKENSAIMSVGRKYISGSVGSQSYKSETDKSIATGKDITYHYSDKYFLNGMVTNSGSGAIMLYSANVDEQEDKRKDEFNHEIRFIEACGSAPWTEIQVISKGKNVAYGKPVAPVLGSVLDPSLGFITDNNLSSTGSSNGTDCVTVDIGRDMNNNNEYYKIDQIGVFGTSQNSITLYTEDKQPFTTTGVPMGGGLSGMYFNAYND